MSESPGHDAINAYAQALCAALEPLRAKGVTQKEIAEATYVSAAALSRYLSGQRIADRAFLENLTRFLAEHGHVLPIEQLQKLQELRQGAQDVGSSSVRLERAQEQIEDLKARIAEMSGQHDSTLAETVLRVRAESSQSLAAVEDQLRSLTEDLLHARERAQAAEAGDNALQETVEAQDKRLAHASQFMHSIEAELAVQQDEVQRLRQEITVLRRQLALLTEEAVPAPSTQASRLTAVTPITVREEAGRNKEGQSTPGASPPGLSRSGPAPRKSPWTRAAGWASGPQPRRWVPQMSPTPRPNLPKRILRELHPVIKVTWISSGVLAFVAAYPIAYLTGASYATQWQVDGRPSWWILTLDLLPYGAISFFAPLALLIFAIFSPSDDVIDVVLKRIPEKIDIFNFGILASAVLGVIFTSIGPAGPGLWWENMIDWIPIFLR